MKDPDEEEYPFSLSALPQNEPEMAVGEVKPGPVVLATPVKKLVKDIVYEDVKHQFIK
jgi:hypothetical protein